MRRRVIAGFDFVLDCIDQVNSKAALIARARAVRHSGRSPAAPRVVDSRSGDEFRSGDLAVIAGDPLLAKVRQRLRRDYGFPRETGSRRTKFHVMAVYSDEPVQRPASARGELEDAAAGLACAGYGSSVAVTATMGFVAASVALTQLTQAPDGSA